jgi:hypothetical protein
MMACGANPLQKVNIAAKGKEHVHGLVMDQAYAEYQPREVGKQATQALHTAFPSSVFTGAEEWPIMDMLVENMREANRKHIVQHGKPMEKFCEECGRSHGVPFHTCNRCGMVVFCRDKCKMRAFSTHHRHVCVTYRKLKGATQWGEDGDATQWRPRMQMQGKQFELEHWERSSARPFTGTIEEDPALAYTSSVRATPIRTTSRQTTSESRHAQHVHPTVHFPAQGDEDGRGGGDAEVYLGDTMVDQMIASRVKLPPLRK